MPNDDVPLENRDEHGGVTDDDLTELLESRYGSDTVDAGASGDASGEGSGAAPPAAPSPGATESWEFNLGTTEQPNTISISREQARAYAEFEQFLAANPELAEAIGGTITGTHKFMPVDTPAPGITAPGQTEDGQDATLTPPEALDLTDPVQKAVWERLVDTNTALAKANELIQRHESQLQQSQLESTTSLVNKSTELWRESNKDITDEDMNEIKAVAARLNVVPSLMSPTDPLTGLPRQVDPIKALEDAYDLARWQIPRLRDAQLAQFQVEARNNNKRKQKLSSLGGSSGSVPRQPEKPPESPQERRQAMIREMADMLNGNWIQPEDK